MRDRLDEKIGALIASSAPHRSIVRRLFLYDFTSVFTDQQDRGFAILNAVCEHFRIPFSSVKVAGSAQTGHSYFSGRDFAPGVSDLDLAIICPTLFQHYSQEVYEATQAYSDLSRFPRKAGVSVAQDFRNHLSAGWFRPDLMPGLSLKTEWFSFFNRLSTEHTDLFHDINAGINLSEVFFEIKNRSIITAYRRGKS